jgi:hypothetical protein
MPEQARKARYLSRLPLAEPKAARAMGDRAYWLLCGGSSQNFYGGEGYTYPDGLHRHLEISYNAHRCAIVGLCRENVRMEQEARSWRAGRSAMMVEICARRDTMPSGTYQILRCAGDRDPLRDPRPDEF